MSSPATQLKERRFEQRMLSHLDLTSFLKKMDSEDPVRSILVDISIIGIGLRSLDYLKPDSIVRIVKANAEIQFRVAWSKPDPMKEAMWHVGLLATDPTINLKVWFGEQGFKLDSTQTQVIEKPEGATDSSITLSSIRSLLGAVHTSDNSFFKQSGMESLMADRRAFPINLNGTSLVVVLPKELKPQQVAKLSEKEAKLVISVYKRARTQLGDSRWVLIRPS